MRERRGFRDFFVDLVKFIGMDSDNVLNRPFWPDLTISGAAFLLTHAEALPIDRPAILPALLWDSPDL
ncbi:MAG: hypothetical protein COC23_00770 [Hyphomicrobiales bacterium]|nr:MAG: hypothetical protein COC23_00770 [Hyphomicrobiales bacterium]